VNDLCSDQWSCLTADKSYHRTVSSLVEHIMPCIHGLTRGLAATPGLWKPRSIKHLDKVIEPLSIEANSTIASISRGSFIHSSSEGRFVLSVLARYETSDSPFSTNFVTKCDWEISQAILVGVVTGSWLAPEENWEKLATGVLKNNTSLRDTMPDLSDLVMQSKKALQDSLEALRDLEDNEDSIIEGTDQYELQNIAHCLVRWSVRHTLTNGEADSDPYPEIRYSGLRSSHLRHSTYRNFGNATVRQVASV
jgi:hypothetical protein